MQIPSQPVQDAPEDKVDDDLDDIFGGFEAPDIQINPADNDLFDMFASGPIEDQPLQEQQQ